ncbi:hypothetical protein [Actinokineospora globicatena]|uniref:hypothetical protein n=1 Tax=Actinokineospora globicatena TaxID=103729 RepID=UPI0020A47594|nr:hypothetical protein [Actinokineospora globicatena]MCP2304621.1 hypothetical protein [Actinokineospora globicatena]GLW78007.1 hypothetical protein Aglo01_24890 [Actinokineospora globicatena]GLW85327.1 hypothetical protein Aglo02_29670 [Actinokineospora globicatena]
MRILLVPLVAVLAAACTSAPPPPAKVPEVPQFATTTTKARVERTALPSSCGRMLSRQDLDDVVDTVITGRTEVVVGVGLPKIGRTGRIDCYFGIPQDQPPAAAVLTVGMAAYTDEASAKQRVQETVDSERDKGIAAEEVKVGADTGYLLDGDTRTVVVAHGKLTVAVTVAKTLATPEQVGKLADLALTER